MISWSEAQDRREIVEVCQRLHQQGWLAACDGNVSMRLDDGRILITPSARPKGMIAEHEMAILSLDGETLAGRPSSEKLMHLEIYRHCPKAKAVVHAHPPTAIAWTIGHPELKELPANSCSELILAMGSVPFVPYARPGTLDMGTNLLPYLPAHRVLLLRNHGALTWGEDLEEAYLGTERLEHSALLLLNAASLGKLHELPATEIAALKELRKEIGERVL